MAITVMDNKNIEILTVVSVYLEPNSEWKEIDLESIFNWAGERKEMVIMGGDFNAKSKFWGGDESDKNGEE